MGKEGLRKSSSDDGVLSRERGLSPSARQHEPFPQVRVISRPPQGTFCRSNEKCLFILGTDSQMLISPLSVDDQRQVGPVETLFSRIGVVIVGRPNFEFTPANHVEQPNQAKGEPSTSLIKAPRNLAVQVSTKVSKRRSPSPFSSLGTPPHSSQRRTLRLSHHLLFQETTLEISLGMDRSFPSLS